MITRYFVLDDISSSMFGICMSRWPSFSAPKPRVEKVTVSGRNGDLIFYDGSFENVEGKLNCFVLHGQAYDTVAEANKWLCKAGYRRFTYDGDVEAYRLVRVANGAEMAVRMMHLDPFEITLDCKPQRFLLSGEIPFSFEGYGVHEFDCPAFEGLPLMKIFGNGTVTLNGETITIVNSDDWLMIDSETQNAYKNNMNMNSKISCEQFPKVVAGTNRLVLGGDITKVELTPRWYTL